MNHPIKMQPFHYLCLEGTYDAAFATSSLLMRLYHIPDLIDSLVSDTYLCVCDCVYACGNKTVKNLKIIK